MPFYVQFVKLISEAACGASEWVRIDLYVVNLGSIAARAGPDL